MATKRHLAPWGRAAAAARPAAKGTTEEQHALAALEGKPALYHCISRVVWREMAFEALEKEQFAKLLRKWEAFARVRVLTYCVMTNHFHLLVEVPERPDKDPADEELVEHLGLIYGARKLAEVRWELERLRGQGNHAAAEALRQRYLRRMWDLSAFMKDFKQDYSHWFNKRHAKVGHLWERRFTSVLVEDGHAARVVAGYIDLNPVRAGMVGRAEDYRWSGWGEAVGGKGKAREGIRQVMLERALGGAEAEVALGDVEDWRAVAGGYRALLAEDEARRRAAEGTAGAEALGGEAGGRRMSEAELVRRQVRYFADGMVVGTKGFVDGVFRLSRGWFGDKRSTGARKMRCAATTLHALRDLRVRPYGSG